MLIGRQPAVYEGTRTIVCPVTMSKDHNESVVVILLMEAQIEAHLASCDCPIEQVGLRAALAQQEGNTISRAGLQFWLTH